MSTAWTAYERALVEVDVAARQVAELEAARSRRQFEQRAALDDGGRRLTAQRARLDSLGRQLDAALPGHDLAPAPTTALSWEDGLAELALQLESADRAADQAAAAGHRPQLLPAWTGYRARNLVVYAAVCLPNAAFSAVVSLVGAEPSSDRFLWFLIVFPVLAVLTGGFVIGRICAPRIRPSDDRPSVPRRQERRHRSVVSGLLIAWASWIVPGQAFELLHTMIAGPGS